MSQEFRKWLVNGLQPTYKWDILGCSYACSNLLLTSWDIQVTLRLDVKFQPQKVWFWWVVGGPNFRPLEDSRMYTQEVQVDQMRVGRNRESLRPRDHPKRPARNGRLDFQGVRIYIYNMYIYLEPPIYPKQP